MNEYQTRMMVSGQVRLKGQDGRAAELRRCMAVLSCDGRVLGIVAAVCVDSDTHEVVTVLLGRLPVTPDYRLIPIGLIDHVGEDAVHLRITADSLPDLEQHEAG